MYPGIDGILGTRGSLMLDLVFLAMFAVLPVMAWGIWLARRGRYALHKRVQLTLGVVLLLAVTAFEIDMRFVSGWRERAAPSPYSAGASPTKVEIALGVHLLFAVTTTLLWIFVIVQALRKFPSPPTPAPHGAAHRFWARLAAIDMALTALTGWVFYWLAFVVR